MKLRGICTECGGEMLLDQAVAGQGMCPWCGMALAPANTFAFVEAVMRAERAAEELRQAMRLLNELPGRYRVMPDELLDLVGEEVGWSSLVATPG